MAESTTEQAMIDIIKEKLYISDDVSSDDEDFGNEQDWENMELPVRDKKVPPLFCRACLSPYFGEKREDGSHILTCTKCKRTREVTAEDFRDVPVGERDFYIGDVVSNRFRPLIEEQRRLRSMDLSDPDYIEDEFKKYFYVYKHVLDLMTETVSNMHKILDEYRHQYNESVIKRLAVQAGTLDDITIVVTGSKDTNDLLINPDDYSVPVEVCIQCNVQGKKGIRSADKYVLEACITKKMVEEMPLFQQRLFNYHARAQFALMRTLNDKNKHGSQQVSGKKLRKNRKKLKNKGKDEETIFGPKEFVNCTNSVIYKMSAEFEEKFKVDPMEQPSEDESEDTSSSDASIEEESEQKAEESQGSVVVKYNGARPKVDHKNTPEKVQLRAMIKKYEKEMGSDVKKEEEKRFQSEISYIIPYIMRDAENDVEHEKFDVRHVNKAFKEIMRAIKKRSNMEQRHRKVVMLKQIEKAVMEMTDHVDDIKGEIIQDLQEAYRMKMITSSRDKKEAEDTQNDLLVYRDLLERYKETYEFDKAEEVMKKVDVYRKRLDQLRENHSIE